MGTTTFRAEYDLGSGPSRRKVDRFALNSSKLWRFEFGNRVVPGRNIGDISPYGIKFIDKKNGSPKKDQPFICRVFFKGKLVFSTKAVSRWKKHKGSLTEIGFVFLDSQDRALLSWTHHNLASEVTKVIETPPAKNAASETLRNQLNLMLEPLRANIPTWLIVQFVIFGSILAGIYLVQNWSKLSDFILSFYS